MIFPNSFNLETTLFADDTTLMKSDESLQALELTVKQNLKLANDWFTANKLTLNVGKTQVILFSHRVVTDIEYLPNKYYMILDHFQAKKKYLKKF